MTDRLKDHEVIALLEQVQATGHIGSWIVELDGSDHLRWSAETYRIFGVSEEQFGGKSEDFFALVHPDDASAVRAASASAVAGRAPYDIPHRIVRPDGGVRWVHERAEIVRGPDGRALRMIGTALDIT